MQASELVRNYARRMGINGNTDEAVKKQRKTDIRDYTILSSLAVAIGILVGLASLAFRGLISLMHNAFFLGEFSLGYDFYQHDVFNYGWIIVLVPALGGLLVGLIVKYTSDEVKGDGIPEIMQAVMKRSGRIKAKVGFAKAIASAITIGSGGSAGEEGPVAQIGAAGGSSIGQFFKLSDEKIRILIGCGAAAGIAATFNAPIAGVIFALELILLEFKTRSFVPLVISSVVATVMAHMFIGSIVAFPIAGVADIYMLRSPYELFLYLLLGFIAGLAALFFIRFFYKIEDFFDALKIKNYTKPMLGGLLLGITGLLLYEAFGNYFIFGVGYSTVMPALLSENISGDMMYAGAKLALFMLLLMFLKMLATSLTLGSGGSGGIFAPSLWIGAMLGGAFGIAANLAFPGIAAPFGAYALVGMAAFFAGTSRATLTAIIIMFELTSSYEIILPLMFACVVADAVSSIMSKDTIDTLKISRKGVHYSYDREVNILDTHEVGEIMVRNVECVDGSMTLDQAARMIQHTGHQGFPYLDSEGRLCGIVTHADIRNALNEGIPGNMKLCQIKKECIPEVAYPDQILSEVLEKMAELDYGHIPVVDRNDQTKLVGLITRKDIMRIYKIRAEEKKDHWK